MRLVRILFLIPLVWPSGVGATALSDAVATCTKLDSYCELTGVASSIPLDLVDSQNGHNILEYASKGIWDERLQKLTFFGEGHISNPYTITYTESTNTWAKVAMDPMTFRHSYSNHAINPILGRWYYKDYGVCPGSIRRFATSTNSEFSQSAAGSFGNRDTCYSALEYFPDLGMVIFAGLENGSDWGIQGFTDSLSGGGSWQRIGTNPGTYTVGGGTGQMIYNPVYRFLIFGGDNGNIWKVDQALRITQLASAPCSMSISGPFPILSVDPVSGDFVLLCGSGPAYKFDPTVGSTGTWTQIASAAPFFESGGPGNGYFSVIAIASKTHGGIFFLECGGVANCRNGLKPRMWFLRHSALTTFDIKKADAGVIYSESFVHPTGRDIAFYADSGIDSVNCASALKAAGLDNGWGYSFARSGPGNTGPVGSGGCHWPQVDSATVHLRGHAMKLSVLAGSTGSGTTGQWIAWFRRLGDGNFFYVAPGSKYGNTIYIQTYFKADSGFLTTTATCTGGCYGWKTFLIYGNPPNGGAGSAVQITNTLYEAGVSPSTNTAIPTMYGQRGVDDSYYATLGVPIQIGPQPSVNCTFANAQAIPPQAPCIRFNANQWYEYTWKITVNPPSNYAGNGGAGCAALSRPSSSVQLFIDGVKIIDNPCASIGYNNATFGDGDGI